MRERATLGPCCSLEKFPGLRHPISLTLPASFSFLQAIFDRKNGSITEDDYRNVKVSAAYQPMAFADWGEPPSVVSTLTFCLGGESL